MSLPVSVTSSKSGTVSYEYDFRGNRTKMTDSTGVTAFSYSPLSELVSETHGDISKSYSYDKNSARTAFTLSKGGTALLSNTYDASGNRLTFDKTSLSQRSYGYLPGNISWYSTSNNAFAEYTHDNNGNILSKTGNRVTDYTM